ncbi:4-hydroxythreonine-4-phosphate dehydrogenase PdxA [Amylibacter kogurei]|uniref:4-hydroxythreonine-4-phosphate dehydrogenase n=1 Tax=Paramylibacter kogurei TaxID=1889778 RepID=A0A2G5K7B3_9RHOB|nr:4-hydroxythreonine-4-phosphate dehydrogenase PdxA [Amylibacter kogurei]PIB24902.1 4-hydroxythreonine-4-phosphate dehydrogenase PdxA [Amylibacter kogurei]
MTAPIALTSGDPSGVGLEIALRAWDELREKLPFFLIADYDYMRELAQQSGHAVVQITTPDETRAAAKTGLPVLHCPFVERPNIGVEHPQNAISTIASIDQAVEFTKSGQASAVCTLPINKKVLHDGAGFAYPGHTEYLAHLGGVDRSFMMLLAPELRVVPVTIHIALADVQSALTPELLIATITATHGALQRDFGVKNPRLAVAGLNPHAGEGGAMGHDEIEMIRPTLDQLRSAGLDITGPLPADTMFHPAAREKYDTAICMYHDQALIPLKTLNFSEGVNTTLGLPFIRTSPDHGTAFDIAGRGIADARSLIAALKCAGQMAKNRARYDAK